MTNYVAFMHCSHSRLERETEEEMVLSSHFQLFLLLSFLLLFVVEARLPRKVFDVTKYGAIGDGKSDNTKAFSNAWCQACQSTAPSMVLIPKGKFLLGPIEFKGPCKSPINFHLSGVLVAHSDQASLNIEQWILFKHINRLTINGGGSFDGQGPSAWPYNTCGKNSHCKSLPRSISLAFVTDSYINHITSINSKSFHFVVYACSNIIFRQVHIIAPGDSPNTDGIHIGKSNNIRILNSIIGTGDDCVSMGPGTKNVNISNVQCGPGHGISIGSLGRRPNEDGVNGVHVTNCNLTNTMNGVRIKTWGQPYHSTVSQVTFDHINLNNVSNPVVIDQQYCPLKNCALKPSGVKISDVQFNNIRGTSSTKVAVTLICSHSNPCEKILIRDINIDNQGGGGSTSYCVNAHGVCYGQHHPRSCLLK